MIPFITDFERRYGEAVEVSPLIRRVLAANGGRFTGPGTGTLIVGRGEVAMVDPGPELESHFDALLGTLSGERVTHVLVTHEHADHSPLGRRLADAFGAVLLGRRAKTTDEHGGVVREEASDDPFFSPDQQIEDGALIAGPGWRLRALHTPGHTHEHFCYALEEESTLLCGDHVMAWSTSIVSPPHGNMGDYMRSLARVRALHFKRLVPTHGAVIETPTPFLDAYIAHRRMRERAILAEIAGGARLAREIVTRLYADVDKALHPAAMHSVWAHLIDLHEQGKVAADPAPDIDARYRLAIGALEEA